MWVLQGRDLTMWPAGSPVCTSQGGRAPSAGERRFSVYEFTDASKSSSVQQHAALWIPSLTLPQTQGTQAVQGCTSVTPASGS